VWTAYNVANDAPEPAPTNASSGNTVEQPTDAAGAAFNADDLAILANAAS